LTPPKVTAKGKEIASLLEATLLTASQFSLLRIYGEKAFIYTSFICLVQRQSVCLINEKEDSVKLRVETVER